MTRKERNKHYFVILNNCCYPWLDLNKSFFELPMEQINVIGELAEAIRCKSEQGKSLARTLYDRAIEGKPF